MKLTKETKFLIIGLGLMGGSYAIALSKQGYRVKAISDRQDSIDFAVQRKYIEEGRSFPDPLLIREADVLIFALYPRTFIEWVESYGKWIPSGSLVTDVTGVKEAVVNRIQAILPDGVEFIASHPMAGREVYGVENATDSIFREANFIVTPTKNNSEEAIDFCRLLGKTLGFSRISTLSLKEHDDMIAFLSQLTHCIAVALMNANDSPHLVDYTGDSFRDLTRIAKINEDMWTELFLLNKEALLLHMDRFEASFRRLRDALEKEDRSTMKELMRKSTERREQFD